MTTDTPTNTVAPNAPVIPAGYTAIGPTIHPRRIDKRNVPGLLLRHVSGPFVFFHDSTVCLCDQQWALEEAVNIATSRPMACSNCGGGVLTPPGVRQRKQYSQNLAGSQLRG